MDCESLFDDSPGGPDRDAVLRHLEGCADCRALMEALAAAPSEDPGLAGAILARTTGAACESARSRLCALVDGELEPFDAGLVDGHLRHCPDCAGLARALRVSAEELPRFAAIDPGPWFVEGVLARTSRRPRAAPRLRRWTAAVAHLLDRPRIALEGAFVAVAFVGVPLAAFQPPIIPVRDAVSGIQASVVIGTRDVRGTTESFLVERSLAVASAVSRRSTDTLESIRARYGTFPGPGASGETGGGTGTVDRSPEAPQETEP